MIPIADEIRARRVPVVTYGLVAINVIVFLYELLQGQNVDQFFMRWGAVPAYITDPAGHPLATVTMLTSMFLHGGLAHLIGNMLYLWIFGDNVEDRLGHVGYLAFYVVAGVLAGLAQILPAPRSAIPAIGASGAVAGVLGVYLLLYPKAPVRVVVPAVYVARITRVPAVLVLGMWFVLQIFNGFLTLGSGGAMSTGGIAWFAHIGGFVAGLVVGAVLRAARPPQRRSWR
jgi:membrane associated rhomboid family serine protease